MIDDHIVELRRRDVELIVVSSGATALVVRRLRLPARSTGPAGHRGGRPEPADAAWKHAFAVHDIAIFAIGGADGHSDALRSRARKLVSFGRLTIAHRLVRILVLEQVYRSFTILRGEPYHRS